jgi:polysaccharide export outer membrane protein
MVCCAPGHDLPPLPQSAVKPYHLGTGDKVRVNVFGEEQLTGEFGVDDSGCITLPLIGPFKASDLSAAELGAALAAALQERNLYHNPSVTVEITAYRPVFIIGEVSRPGEYPYRPGMTVLTAVAVAGGFTYRAVEDYASVVRTTGDKPMEGKVVRHSLVEPGDVITIFERRF